MERRESSMERGESTSSMRRTPSPGESSEPDTYFQPIEKSGICIAQEPWEGRDIRMVVAGERRTGKSTLIASAQKGEFVRDVGFKQIDTVLASDFTQYKVPVTLIDTGRMHDPETEDKLKIADAVVLTYACNIYATFKKLKTEWLPYLTKLELNNVPVVIVGCKQDLPTEKKEMWEYFDIECKVLMDQFRNIETCLECSAKFTHQAKFPFGFALRAILYPIPPLMNLEKGNLSFRLVRALNRIFSLSDIDRDGALNQKELNGIQYKYYGRPIDDAAMDDIRKIIKDTYPEGVNPDGSITMNGFQMLHQFYVKMECHETTWTIVRVYGYGNDLRFKGLDLLRYMFGGLPDQSLMLGSKARIFLAEVFHAINSHSKKALPAVHVDHFISTELDREFDLKDEIATTASGGLTCNGFLSMWELMALRDPAKTFAKLIDLGYLGTPESAFNFMMTRKLCPMEQRIRRIGSSEHRIIRCLVFGPKKAGKSAVLDNFLGRKFLRSYTPTTKERFAADVVHIPEDDCIACDTIEICLPFASDFLRVQAEKTLILQEIPEDKVHELLSKKVSLPICDFALFVYDSSDDGSWVSVHNMLTEFDCYCDQKGFNIPRSLVGVERPRPETRGDPILVSHCIGREEPMAIVNLESRKQKDLFGWVVYNAVYPYLGVWYFKRFPGFYSNFLLARKMKNEGMGKRVGSMDGDRSSASTSISRRKQKRSRR